MEVSLRTDEAFQLRARRPIDTAVAAPQENMLEHGIDRRPARTKIVGKPPQQRPAIRLHHTAGPEMPKNHREKTADGAPGTFTLAHRLALKTELPRHIEAPVAGYRHRIRSKKPRPSET